MTPTTKPPPLTQEARTDAFAVLQTYQASAIARKPENHLGHAVPAGHRGEAVGFCRRRFAPPTQSAPKYGADYGSGLHTNRSFLVGKVEDTDRPMTVAASQAASPMNVPTARLMDVMMTT